MEVKKEQIKISDFIIAGHFSPVLQIIKLEINRSFSLANAVKPYQVTFYIPSFASKLSNNYSTNLSCFA